MTDHKAMSDTDRLINMLLLSSIQRKTFGSMADWFKDFNQQTRPFSKSIDRAILGGRLSLNASFAFISGYQSAIESLFKPEKTQLSSFCMTEEKGNHSRAVETRLFQESGNVFLSGKKQFVSGANDSECLYIACRDEREGDGLDEFERPKLKLVSVSTCTAGLQIQALPALGFLPEVSHGKVFLDKVAVSEDQILPGDGYLNYVKAFRNYEDLHVLAAITGYRLGEAIDGQWPQPSLENHLSLLLAIRSLSDMDLRMSAAHIGLAACRTQFNELIANTNFIFAQHNPQAYGLWDRDKLLLDVAKGAHHKRTQTAWKNYRSL